MILLGDVHQDKENLRAYLAHREAQPNSQPAICVGDLGFDYDFFDFTKAPLMFIDGNHDFFPVFTPDHGIATTRIRPGLVHISRGTIFAETLFIGGAESIDKARRLEGQDWFREESITYDQMSKIVSELETNPVKRIISHTCPASVAKKVIDFLSLRIGQKPMTYTPYPSEKLLEELLKIAKPVEWYFGHFHVSFQTGFMGCKFRCLAPGELLEIEDKP